MRHCGARLLSIDMWFASVLGFRSFFDWLRSKVICVGGVGVADAGVIGRFIEILSVGGFEFCLCGFFLCRAQLQGNRTTTTPLSKLTISPDMFKDYYIDYIPYEEQQAFVKTKLKDFLKLQEKYRKAQEQLSQDIANLSD